MWSDFKTSKIKTKIKPKTHNRSFCPKISPLSASRIVVMGDTSLCSICSENILGVNISLCGNHICVGHFWTNMAPEVPCRVSVLLSVSSLSLVFPLLECPFLVVLRCERQ